MSASFISCVTMDVPSIPQSVLVTACHAPSSTSGRRMPASSAAVLSLSLSFFAAVSAAVGGAGCRSASWRPMARYSRWNAVGTGSPSLSAFLSSHSWSSADSEDKSSNVGCAEADDDVDA